MARKKHAQMRVYFQDEAHPRIRTGWRGVDVVKTGPKWVRIRDHASGREARLPKVTWEKLLASKANAST